MPSTVHVLLESGDTLLLGCTPHSVPAAASGQSPAGNVYRELVPSYLEQLKPAAATVPDFLS